MHTLISLPAEKSRSMVLNPPLSDAEFEALCLENDLIQFERTREGEILMHSPTGGFTSSGNANLTAQLYGWWKMHSKGRVFDSNGGFFLPDGSMLSPDAAYVSPARLNGLTKDALTGLPYLCPDFVVELLSNSDSLPKTRQKMQRWLENGAALGWLIDPYEKKIYVYEADREVVAATGATLAGTGPVDGFILDANELWQCYEL